MVRQTDDAVEWTPAVPAEHFPTVTALSAHTYDQCDPVAGPLGRCERRLPLKGLPIEAALSDQDDINPR